MKFIAIFASTVIVACLAEAKTTNTGRTGPVEKVVNLLKDLQSKITQDGKVEQQIYDKYACWCEKSSSTKAAAIEQAQDDLRALGQDVLKYKGEIAVLEAEMAQLQKEIEANKEAQAQATAIRQKENEAYQAETAEMKQALAALQKAIIVLSKGTTLVQVGGEAFKAVEAFVQAMPTRTSMNATQTALLSEFISSSDLTKYAPQSLTVQGILRDMYETFSSDLESATQVEANANTVFEDLIATKMEELQNLEETHAKKAAAKATAEQNLADTTQSYDDTEAQMKADVKFFDETKSACEAKSAEWNTRNDLRKEELKGIKEALEILTSDEARELFSSAIKAGVETGTVGDQRRADEARVLERDMTKVAQGNDRTGIQTGNLAGDLAFLQIDQRTAATPIAGAYNALKGIATQVHSVWLAMLAAQVTQAKVGHFDKVIAAIDQMMQTLKDEDAADIAKRDQCLEEYKQIDSTIANVTWLITNNVAKIDKLQSLIEKREAQKEETIESIAAVTKQIADMTAQRTEEHGDFKAKKAEDQAAIELLEQARAALSKYYSNHSIELGPIQGEVKGLSLASLRQGPDFVVGEFDAPDAVFSGKGKRKNDSKGIIQLLTSLIEDLSDETTNGMADEEASQLEYERLLKAAQDLKSNLENKKVNLEGMIADRDEDKSDEEQLKIGNEADLKDERDYKASIKTDCDWIIGAFEKRAGKRQKELEGLTGAKEFLAGYQAEKAAFVEENHVGNFDDTRLAKIRFLGLRP